MQDSKVSLILLILVITTCFKKQNFILTPKKNKFRASINFRAGKYYM